MADGKRVSENGSRAVRLNKFIADCGIASRRKADEIIEDGSITVNGKTSYELGRKIDPLKDSVKYNGKLIKPESLKLYYAFHKPKGVLTTLSDPEGRPCLGDYLQDIPFRLFAVGRLDWDSEGLILLTNDGDFANKISHPSHKVSKLYLVKLNTKVSNDKLQKLLNGVSIKDGGRVRAKKITRVRNTNTTSKDWLRVEIAEGKNRQIRKMFAKIGYDVEKLQRISIGGLELGNLKRGKLKLLTKAQVQRIFKFQKPKSKRKVSAKREKF